MARRPVAVGEYTPRARANLGLIDGTPGQARQQPLPIQTRKQSGASKIAWQSPPRFNSAITDSRGGRIEA